MLEARYHRVVHHSRRCAVCRTNDAPPISSNTHLRHTRRPTLVDGEYPPDIECWLVYQGDGGIISLPMYVPSSVAAATVPLQCSSINTPLPFLLVHKKPTPAPRIMGIRIGL